VLTDNTMFSPADLPGLCEFLATHRDGDGLDPVGRSEEGPSARAPPFSDLSLSTLTYTSLSLFNTRNSRSALFPMRPSLSHPCSDTD
jgi:hypothetical protein